METERDPDQIIMEIVADINETLPFQEIEARLSKEFREGTCTSLPLATKEVTPLTSVLQEEKSLVPDLIIQVSRDNNRVEIQPPNPQEI